MANRVEAEDAVRNAISRAEDLGYRVQIDGSGRGLWNVFLKQGPAQTKPGTPVDWRKRIPKDEIAGAINYMVDVED